MIEPPEGQDYKIVSGEANSILKELIADLSLDDLFTASSVESSINILYQFDRYTPAYRYFKRCCWLMMENYRSHIKAVK